VSEFDMIVIGSGPAGQKAAIQAAKFRRRVALVERRHMVGGVCTNTGTIPSKTLREAVLYLTGWHQRGVYGASYRVKDEIGVEDLFQRTHHVIEAEIEVIRDQLTRNHVQIVSGEGRFVDPHTVAVRVSDDNERTLTAESIVIAVGTNPARPADVAFDDRTVLDSDGILNLAKIPSSLVVVGAGVIGIEYASMFAALGTKVTVVEKRPHLLDFCDDQMVEALQYHLRELGVTFRFGERVVGVQLHGGGSVTELESGKRIPSDAVFYAAGREGATRALDLAKAGLAHDERGRIAVDDTFRTAAPHIYAVGDVIGFPSLAATSAEQGRLAACTAFGEKIRVASAHPPIGVYTIPEISFVGKTEEELTADRVPYEIGISRWRELARGQIIGDKNGLLKLLVSPTDRSILGVHAFGTGATELIHIGQAVMALGGTVDYLVDTVFNYPTLAESYKVAALDAANKLHHLRRVSA
jgi:NAD(P) transhydrogenase